MKKSIQTQKGSAWLWFAVILIVVVAGYLIISSRYSMTSPNAASTIQVQSTIVKQAATPVALAAISVEQIKNALIPDFIDTTPGQPLQFVNGIYQGSSSPATGPAATFTLNTAKGAYAYGDLNGDGASDMAVTATGSTGGTGVFTFLLAFVNKNGKPEYVDSVELGDRIQLKGLSISNGVIIADIITQGPGEPLCCGTTPATLKFKLKGNSLVSIAN